VTIKLFDYQKEAVKKALSLPNTLIAMRAGSGKTIISMFLANYLLKKNIVDKVLYGVTVSSSVAIRSDYRDKLGIKLPSPYEKEDKVFDFLSDPDQKVGIIKHAMFRNLGLDNDCIKKFKELKKQGLRTALFIDEAHNIQNPTSLTHEGHANVRFFFDRQTLFTATPYRSCLSQLFGTTHLIQPKLWGNSTRNALAEFKRRYLVIKMIKNWKTKRERPEIIAYKNLQQLRRELEPFTYFYYPPIKLNFFNHNITLNDYSEYDELCMGIMTLNDLEKIKSGG